MKQFLSLEGLRGVLALMVCFGHYGIAQIFSRFGLQFNMHFAVDIFFVLSGFVLAHSNYFSEKSLTGFEFTIKRFARLYPLHLLTLITMLGLYYNTSIDIPLAKVIQHGLLIQNLGGFPVDNMFNFPSWSISVEFWGSILFFILITLIKRRLLILLLCVSWVILTCIYYPDIIIGGAYEINYGWLNSGVLRALTGIALGVAIYLLHRTRWLRSLVGSPYWGWVFGGGLLAFLFFEMPNESAILFYGLCFGLITYMALNPNFLSMLSTKLFVELGAISYAIYLLHIPLYKLFQTCWGDMAVKGCLGKLVLLPTLIGFSYLIYRFFEKPLQLWIRRSSNINSAQAAWPSADK